MSAGASLRLAIGDLYRNSWRLVPVNAALGLVLALDFNERVGLARFEYAVLLLFATVGMMVMVSANDLMALYIGLAALGWVLARRRFARRLGQ